MKNCKNLYLILIYFSCIIILFFTITVYFKWPWYERAISGEKSPGTWLSSSLLICMGVQSLIIVLIFKSSKLWWLMASGFFLLAADESFLIHENVKETILFEFFNGNFDQMGARGELLIFIYIICGIFLIYFAIKNIPTLITKILFTSAITIGICSFIFDIFYLNMFLEDLFKILAEIILTITLFMEISNRIKNKNFKN